MSRTARPAHQLFLGGLIVALLGWPLVSWFQQLSILLGECGDGLGNPALTGELTARYCVLSRVGDPVVRVPWIEDVTVTLLLVTALGCVLGGLLVPRWSRWSTRFAWTAAPLLLTAGLLMSGRGFRRMGGTAERFQIGVTDRPHSFMRVQDGWVVGLPLRHYWVPDTSGLALGLSFFAGLALLVLVSALLADQRLGSAGSQFDRIPEH